MTAHFRPSKTAGKTESLSSLVSRAYDENGRDPAKAIDALVLEFRKRPSLHEEIYRLAAKTLIAGQVGKDRKTIMAGGDAGSFTITDGIVVDLPTGRTIKHKDMPSAQSTAAVDARRAAREVFEKKLTGLYLTPFLWDGRQVMLGTATPEELRPIAENYRAQGATMVRTGRWLDKIIASAKNGKPIHTSLTLKELERMQKDANETAV